LHPLFGPCVRPPQRYAVVPHGGDSAARQFSEWLALRCQAIAQESLALVQALLQQAGRSGGT
jgi:hypothetical protein